MELFSVSQNIQFGEGRVLLARVHGIALLIFKVSTPATACFDYHQRRNGDSVATSLLSGRIKPHENVFSILFFFFKFLGEF